MRSLQEATEHALMRRLEQIAEEEKRGRLAFARELRSMRKQGWKCSTVLSGEYYLAERGREQMSLRLS